LARFSSAVKVFGGNIAQRVFREAALQTANVKWMGGEEFVTATPSGHQVPFDADRQHNSAPGPMEMLLAALGACTSVDVVLILAKKRQKLDSLEVAVSGERASEPPAVWTKIEMVYKLSGKLDEKAVRDAIDLSQTKYCSVAAMLGKTAKITHHFEILPAKA
jgi:putative redox protein